MGIKAEGPGDGPFRRRTVVDKAGDALGTYLNI